MNRHEHGGNTNTPLDKVFITGDVPKTIRWKFNHEQAPGQYLGTLHQAHDTTLAHAKGNRFRQEVAAFAYQVKEDVPILEPVPFKHGLVVGLEIAKRGLSNIDDTNIYNDMSLATHLDSLPLNKDTLNPNEAWGELRDQYADTAEPYMDILKYIRQKADFPFPYVDLAVACGYALRGAQNVVEAHHENKKAEMDTLLADIAAMKEEVLKREATHDTQDEDAIKKILKAFNKEFREYQKSFPDPPNEQPS